MPTGSHRFPVGSISCTVLADGYSSYPLDWFFPGADSAGLASALEVRGLPRDRIVTPYTCLLIETGSRIVLVDTGAGPSTATCGAIGARLAMAGVNCNEVDTVILTHAHPDHIGGTIDDRGRPAFPKACYVISELEHEFWMTSRTDLSGMQVPDEIRHSIRTQARRSLAAIHFQLDLIERETEISPGIRVIPAPGHTPGHLAVLISSGTSKLLNLGDAALHPLHLEEPRWQNGFDCSGTRAAATRKALMERATAENMRIMGFHFPFPSVGRVTARDAGGWAWLPGW